MQTPLAVKEETRQKKLDSYWENELNLVFNDIAERYDSANDFFSFGLWTVMRRRFVGRVKLPEGAEVLDVCAGTNAVGIDVLSKNPSFKITAIDRSEGMQETGTARAKAKGFKIRSIISDVHELPFGDATFDGATLEAATRHLEVKKVFKEVYRVLKPGGSFYHHDLVKPKNPIVGFFYYQYLKVMIPITTLTFWRKGFMGDRKRALKLRAYFIEAINIFYTSDELTELLKEAGFKDVKAKATAGGTAAVHIAKK